MQCKIMIYVPPPITCPVVRVHIIAFTDPELQGQGLEL